MIRDYLNGAIRLEKRALDYLFSQGKIESMDYVFTLFVNRGICGVDFTFSREEVNS